MNGQSDQAAATRPAERAAVPIPWPLKAAPPRRVLHRPVERARDMADAYRLLVY